MESNIHNPFVVSGYFGPEYFCDREIETQQLISSIKNGRNLNLYNIRRIGKSALIQHVFSQLPDNYITVFLDIEKTESLSDLTDMLLNSLVQKIDEIDGSLFRKIIQWASGLGVSISLDETTGLPKMDLNYKKRVNTNTLEKVFSITEFIPNKTFVIAIDEFQQITQYPESNTESTIRSITQQYPHIRFIFSGSSRHLMERIFTDVNRPFYQSTENVRLDYIDNETYVAFAQKFLPDCDQQLIKNLIEWCRCHTYYVQYALNHLYEIHQSKQDYSLNSIKKHVLKMQEFYYFSIRKLVTKDQWKIMKAIAQNEPVQKPTSSEFLGITGMAASSMKHNLDQLIEKDLVLQENDGLKIYNVFLGHLLSISKN